MIATLRTLFASKKFITMLVGLAVALGSHLGLQLDEKLTAAIIGLFAILIGAQGLADQGKEAARVKSGESGFASVGAMLFVAVIGALVAIAVLQVGCSTLRSSGARAAGGFVDCMRPEPQKMLAELSPTFRDLVQNATGNDGHVDRSKLRLAASTLISDTTRCAFASVIEEALRPSSSSPNAPQASGLEVNQAQLREVYDELRADLWSGQTFRLEAP